MTRDDIVRRLQPFSADLKRSGVTALFMFGSRARGDNHPDSDLDLFVEYAPGGKIPSYFKLLEARLNFEEQVGIPVHLGTRASLDPAIRPHAEHDAVRIF